MPPIARTLGATALWLALPVALVAAGLWVGPGGMLGYEGGEIYGHAWVQWWHADALPAWPVNPSSWLPWVKEWRVIDPLPTAFAAAIGRALGQGAGWNAWILGSVLLAAIGGAWAARRAGGDPVVGGLALALAPALQGALVSGLTEDLSVGLAAIALALVGDRDPRKAALGGIAMGGLAACGMVLAWATAGAALGLGLCMLWQDRSRLRSLILGAALALLTTAPLAWQHARRLSGVGHRLGSVQNQVEPLWRLNPWLGVDLASYLTPGRVDPDGALIRMHPGYLGLSLLVLALWGGRSRWWLVLCAVLLLAPGRQLSLAGHPLGLGNPFGALMDLLPMGSLVNHAGRLLLVGAIALAVLAARGAARLGPRGRVAARLVVLLDLALLSPVGLPLSTTMAPALSVTNCDRPLDEIPLPGAPRCLDDLPAGPLLHLPMAGPGVHFQRPLLLQPQHRRPLLLNPNQPGLPPALGDSPTGRWLVGLAFPRPPPPPERVELPAGLAVLLVEAPHIEAVAAVLGPPSLRGPDSAAWAVAAP